MSTNQQYKIMIFRPTLEEMKDFSKYIAYMESMGANKAGLAKIIPPPEWCPRKNGYDDVLKSKFKIKNPIEQEFSGTQGKYVACNIERKTYSIAKFKAMAESDRYKRPPNLFDFNDIERQYWRSVTLSSPVYGADVEGSLYDEDCEEFNVAKLGTCLDLVCNAYNAQIKGVNTPYLYFGMFKATFVWHTEDMDLYSINYLHFGDPKTWYAIPPEHGFRFESMMKSYFPNTHKTCPAFLRHKTHLVSPQVLRDHRIPFNRITQEAGEFMITFPFSYHAGFNHGFNCAESTNFAIPRWVEYGKRALRCRCSIDAVKIDMDAFIKLYQPDRYQLWLDGQDIGPHPENPNQVSAAPGPNCDEMPKTVKSKRQAAATKQTKNETECENSDNTACPEVKPPRRGRGRPRTKVPQPVECNDNCSDDNSTTTTTDNNHIESKESKDHTDRPEVSQPIAVASAPIAKPAAVEQNAFRTPICSPICSPIKQSPGSINRSPQIISFSSFSALDRLSEDTKLNVSIQLSSDAVAGHSGSKVSTGNDQTGQSLTGQFMMPFKTKAALKLYENVPQFIPKQDNGQTSGGGLQAVAVVSSGDWPAGDALKRSLDAVDNETKRPKKEPDLKTCFPNLTLNQTTSTTHSESNQSPHKSFITKFYNSASQKQLFDVRCQQKPIKMVSCDDSSNHHATGSSSSPN